MLAASTQPSDAIRKSAMIAGCCLQGYSNWTCQHGNHYAVTEPWTYPPCNWTGQYLTPREPEEALHHNLHAPEVRNIASVSVSSFQACERSSDSSIFSHPTAGQAQLSLLCRAVATSANGPTSCGATCSSTCSARCLRRYRSAPLRCCGHRQCYPFLPSSSAIAQLVSLSWLRMTSPDGATLVPDEPLSCALQSPCCGEFMVSRDRIRGHSREHYKLLLDRLVALKPVRKYQKKKTNSDGFRAGYMLEQAWYDRLCLRFRARCLPLHL